MPQTLQEFIQECQQIITARRAAEQVEKDRLEQEFQDLLQSVKADLRRRIVQAIPQPLRQFTDYAGGRPSLEELQGYPSFWTPSAFRVDAPGLRLIKFTTSAGEANGPLVITEILVFDPNFGDTSFGTDWTEAVAAAVIGA